MAQTMIDNNYDIMPVMEELLKSEHFYDISLRGSIIRGPLEMMFGISSTLVGRPICIIGEDAYLGKIHFLREDTIFERRYKFYDLNVLGHDVIILEDAFWKDAMNILGRCIV
jgi:hypothetical protein